MAQHMPCHRCKILRGCIPLILTAATVGTLAWRPVRGADLSGSVSQAVAVARSQPTLPVKFDPAVVPAGGAGCCESGYCGHGAVPRAGFQHAGPLHAAGCREGMCVPSCPVRPGQFGYYGTQWRRWPGQGVVQASAAEAATPAAPPRSAVPGADEESPAQRTPSSGEPRTPSASGPAPLDEQPAPGAAERDAAAALDDNPAGLLEPPPAADGRRDSAAVPSGPWSRLVANAELPEGYAPPDSDRGR